MLINLPTDTFSILFNLIEIDETLYKFSVSVKHKYAYIQFGLPKNYQVWLFPNDIHYLISELSSTMIELKNKSANNDVFLEYTNKTLITYQCDMEIIIRSGEYYPVEKEGVLNCFFLFDLSAVYEIEDSTKVGFMAKIDFEDIESYLSDLESILKIDKYSKQG